MLKKTFLIFAALLLLFACSPEDVKQEEPSLPDRITATLAPDCQFTWNTGEMISLFEGPQASTFRLSGFKTDGRALFALKSQGSTGIYSNRYAIFPVAAEAACRNEGRVSVILPSEQKFTPGGFDKDAMVFAAISPADSENLLFHGVCGTFTAHLEGSDIIRRLTLSGSPAAPLCGTGIITFDADGMPQIAMSSIGSTSITMDCGNGVDLSESEGGVDFTFVLPPSAFQKGISLDVLTAKGDEFTLEYEQLTSISRGADLKVSFPEISHGSGTSLLSLTADFPGGTVADAVDVAGPVITLCVPRGADLKALKPRFTHNGIAVMVDGEKQKSGKSVQDFSKPVTYTVVSDTGTEASYTVKALEVDIPVIFVSTVGHAEVKDKKNWHLESKFVVLDTDWSYTDYGPTGIKGRGNSSWNYKKKPYAIKIQTRPQKQDVPKETLLGMPGHKRWCLLSNCMGYHFGNQLGYEVGRRSTFEWSPHAAFVELVLNGEHKGLYSLVEQVRIDKYRINIKEMDAEDTTPEKITGGYLLNFDTTMDEMYCWRSPLYNMPVMVKSPDDEVMTASQYSYIQNYIRQMESSLKDDALFAVRDYLNYLDVDTFIGNWMTKELAGHKSKANTTATDFITPRSVFYYKDRGGVLKAGPGWDFDVHFLLHQDQLYCTKCQYYGRLFQDKEFVRRVAELWPDFKTKLLGTDGRHTPITAYVDSLYNVCAFSAARDEAMWKSIWTSYPWYDAATQRDLAKNHLSARIEYMEKEINAMAAAAK